MVERDFSPYGPGLQVPLMLSGQIIARFHQASAAGRGVRAPKPGTGGVGLRPCRKRSAFTVSFRHF